MHVAVGGWFSGRHVGSGRYTDELVAALRADGQPDDVIAMIVPERRSSNVAKVAFEQIVFPRMAISADVAHVPYWAPPIAPSVPTVVTVHDLIPLLLPAYRRRPAVRLHVALVARATGRAAAVIADSESTAADVRAHLEVAPDRLHVVPLGVSPQFSPDPAARREAPYGLYVGGFDARKNVGCLLRAWRRVHAETGTPLLLAGALPEPGNPMAEDPRRQAREAGLPDEAVAYVGSVNTDALPRLYREAAVFAYPSRYEGFGLPPLEAMASGVPVVAADATSLPEVVGDAGRLVSPDDADAWSEAILSVLCDPAEAARMRASGLRRAALFTWSETARRTREVYARAIARL